MQPVHFTTAESSFLLSCDLRPDQVDGPHGMPVGVSLVPREPSSAAPPRNLLQALYNIKCSQPSNILAIHYSRPRTCEGTFQNSQPE